MRELYCVCGAHPVAANDEELVRKVLDHAHEAHPEMGLTEEQQARQMVASQASDTNQAKG